MFFLFYLYPYFLSHGIFDIRGITQALVSSSVPPFFSVSSPMIPLTIFDGPQNLFCGQGLRLFPPFANRWRPFLFSNWVSNCFFLAPNVPDFYLPPPRVTRLAQFTPFASPQYTRRVLLGNHFFLFPPLIVVLLFFLGPFPGA